MKKKLLILFFASGLLLTACGEDTDTPEEGVSTDSVEEVESETAASLPTEEIGEGDFYILSPSGTSEDGDDIILFYDEDMWVETLGVEGWDMDGSHKTFIYVNDELAEEMQMANTQSSIEIPENQYEVGEHTVTAIQYDDDTEEGEPIFVRTVNFEIKE